MKTNITALAALTLAISSASAITISLDYSNHDGSFFNNTTNGMKAKAAVAQAAADLSAAITTTLNAVNTYTFESTHDGGTTFGKITANLAYTNPDTGASVNFTDTLAADEFKIFVGARNLSGSTAGTGGPGGTGYGQSSSYYDQSQRNTLMTEAYNLFDTEMTRGASVVASTFQSTLGTASPTTNFDLDFAPTIGKLWFDKDGSTNWHYDHTTAVAAGKVDLYSVALHEMLHALGMGTYNTWDDLVSGTNWTGAEAIAANGGSGTGLIDAGGGHIAEGTMSVRQEDGTTAQEVALDPSITTGTRKKLTELDLAFMRDLGWQTVAPVPEPSSTLLIGLGTFALILRRRK